MGRRRPIEVASGLGDTGQDVQRVDRQPDLPFGVETLDAAHAAASASSNRPNKARSQATIQSCSASSQPCTAGSSRSCASRRASRDRSNSCTRISTVAKQMSASARRARSWLVLNVRTAVSHSSTGAEGLNAWHTKSPCQTWAVASSSERRGPLAPSTSPSRRAPSTGSPLMTHSPAIPDANDSAASAFSPAMNQSRAARRFPRSEVRRSRQIGPRAPRRPSWAFSAICR